MKKLILLTTLLFLPFTALAVLPIALALIPAVEIGMKIMPFVAAGAAGFGVSAAANYYQATGENPVYKVLGDASQTANDYLYQPAKLAWQQQLVTPSSFPNPEEVYVGVNAHVGAMMQDIVDHVRSSSASLYPNLRSVINANTATASAPTIPDNQAVDNGKVFTANGQKYAISGYMQQIDSGWYTSWKMGKIQAWSGTSNITNVFNRVSPPQEYYLSGTYLYMVSSAGTDGAGVPMSNLSRVYVSGTTSEETIKPVPPPLPPVNFPGIKDAITSNPGAVASDVPSVLKDMPPSQVKPVGESIPSAAPTAADAPTITNSQVNNFYKTNYGDVATYNTTSITSTSTVQDIAKGQAAVEAAKSAIPDINIPDTVTYSGSADLPEANQYNPEITQPEEINFVDKVHTFINSGLPVLSAIRSSGLSASGSPTMNTTIWGNPVVIDFSGQQTPLRAAGGVLVIISLILAYLIVVRS